MLKSIVRLELKTKQMTTLRSCPRAENSTSTIHESRSFTLSFILRNLKEYIITLADDNTESILPFSKKLIIKDNNARDNNDKTINIA